ncbi:hypothetical protein [Sulfurimonas sp.]|uniref:hypothetical protein n=1 Tax=Sulfurimonas sp. TaxID=2022749 RepID=UPI003D0C7A39
MGKATVDKECVTQVVDNTVVDNTDNRSRYEYESQYPFKIRIEIWCEAIFLFFIMILSILLIFLNWKGVLSSWFSLTPEEAKIFKKYLYYSASGMLGGITFGTKYFYRVVARGWWHQDRRVWRITSPFLATIIAFMTGTLIEAQLINSTNSFSTASIVAIGFLAGYFADEAVGKMYEVANVIFGTNNTKKTS